MGTVISAIVACCSCIRQKNQLLLMFGRMDLHQPNNTNEKTKLTVKFMYNIQTHTHARIF